MKEKMMIEFRPIVMCNQLQYVYESDNWEQDMSVLLSASPQELVNQGKAIVKDYHGNISSFDEIKKLYEENRKK